MTHYKFTRILNCIHLLLYLGELLRLFFTERTALQKCLTKFSCLSVFKSLKSNIPMKISMSFMHSFFPTMNCKTAIHLLIASVYWLTQKFVSSVRNMNEEVLRKKYILQPLYYKCSHKKPALVVCKLWIIICIAMQKYFACILMQISS